MTCSGRWRFVPFCLPSEGGWESSPPSTRARKDAKGARAIAAGAAGRTVNSLSAEAGPSAPESRKRRSPQALSARLGSEAPYIGRGCSETSTVPRSGVYRDGSRGDPHAHLGQPGLPDQLLVDCVYCLGSRPRRRERGLLHRRQAGRDLGPRSCRIMRGYVRIFVPRRLHLGGILHLGWPVCSILCYIIQACLVRCSGRRGGRTG